MRCGVSECCSCLSDPLIDLSVQGEVIGDCWSKVHELVIGIKLVVIDGDGWCGDCISCPITLFCLLQADSLLKVLERRVSSVTAILSGCELQLLRRQQTADLWWGRRATSRCLHPLWHWSHPGEQVVLSLGWSRFLMQDSCRMHLLCQWEPTMFGRTHCPDRVGLRWCSGIESGVIQNHRHCSPVSPCSASYSSLHLKSFSFSVPVPANHVSCRMMVILAFSLLSSLFMTALFLVSLMSWRSSERPNVKVRMFQHPSSRAGLFCRILLLLSGVIVYNLQFGCLLVSVHLMKKADCGGRTLSFCGVISLGYKSLRFIMYPS